MAGTELKGLAAAALWPAGDSQGDVAYLGEALKQARISEEGDPVKQAVEAMFARDFEKPPVINRDGVIYLTE